MLIGRIVDFICPETKKYSDVVKNLLTCRSAAINSAVATINPPTRRSMMSTLPNYAKIYTEFLPKFASEYTEFNEVFKKSAEFQEKVSQIALKAIQNGNEVTGTWTTETLGRLENVVSAKSETADYAKAIGSFSSAQIESTSEKMAEYAEIARKAQIDTMEIFLSAGK